jgi:type I restriction enzyme S subunit
MELLPLKEIAEFIRTGKTPPTKEIKYFNGNIHWYSPGDLDNGKYLVQSKRKITQLAFEDKKATSFPKGTLLVTCIGEIAKLGITNEVCSTNQQITAIKPKENIDVSYLFYWFKKNKLKLQNLANSAVVPILNNRNLEQVKVTVPSLEEQKKIAGILDAADSLREKDRQLVEHYDRLKQSLFLDMFGDPFINPKNWPEIALEQIIEEGPQNGLYKPSTAYGSGTPIVRIDAFYNDFVIIEKLKRLRVEKAEIDKFEIFEGDFVINRVNSPSHLGKCGLIPKIDERVVFESNMMRIKFDRNKVNNAFMLTMLSSQHLKNQILNSSKDAVNQSSINQKDVNSFCIPFPPIEHQNVFEKKIDNIEKQKKIAKLSLKKSDDLFNSLLQRAFKGELTKS